MFPEAFVQVTSTHTCQARPRPILGTREGQSASGLLRDVGGGPWLRVGPSRHHYQAVLEITHHPMLPGKMAPAAPGMGPPAQVVVV